jgi:hypothetical protein
MIVISQTSASGCRIPIDIASSLPVRMRANSFSKYEGENVAAKTKFKHPNEPPRRYPLWIAPSLL